MTYPHDLSLTPLAKRALLSLEGGSGKAVGVFAGSVWITEDGVLDDHVLGPGESLALRKPGLVLVEALQDSQLILFDTGGPSGRARVVAAASAAFGAGHNLHAPGVVPARLASPSSAGDIGDSAPSPLLHRADYERLARELRRQAIADAVTWLVQALGKLFARPASRPPASARPGRRALAWQPPR